ncbi:Uncharacterized protein PBTT_01830 [Plasmodiophora brassicae]
MASMYSYLQREDDRIRFLIRTRLLDDDLSETVTPRQLREFLEEELGLDPGTLYCVRQQIRRLTDEVIETLRVTHHHIRRRRSGRRSASGMYLHQLRRLCLLLNVKCDDIGPLPLKNKIVTLHARLASHPDLTPEEITPDSIAEAIQFQRDIVSLSGHKIRTRPDSDPEPTVGPKRARVDAATAAAMETCRANVLAQLVELDAHYKALMGY